MSESNFSGMSMMEFFTIIRSHIRMLLIVFVSIILVCFSYVVTRTPQYTASTTIAIKPISEIFSSFNIPISSITLPKEIEYLKSHGTVLSALDSMDLSSYKRSDDTDFSFLLNDENAVTELISKIDITNSSDVNHLIVSMEHDYPEFARAFLESLYDSFSINLSEFYSEQISKEQQILERRLGEATTSVAAAEFAYKELQSNSTLLESIGSIPNYKRIITFLDMRIQNLEILYEKSHTTDLLQISKIAEANVANLIEEYSKAQERFLYYEINQLLKNEEGINGNHGDRDDNPYSNMLEKQKKELFEQLVVLDGYNSVEQLDLIIANVEFSNLVAIKQYYLDSINKLNSIVIKQVGLEYELNLQHAKVVNYTNQVASLKELQSEVIKPASLIVPPQITVHTGRARTLFIIIVGIGVGLIAGLLIVLIYDTGSDKISNFTYVKTLIGDKISFFHMIPSNQVSKNNSRSKPNNLYPPMSSIAKAYDQLAGIIQFRQSSTGNLVYCFSSLGYGEKSLSTVINLAFSLSKVGKRVLVLGTNTSEVNYEDNYCEIKKYLPSVINICSDKNESDFSTNVNFKLPILHLNYISLESSELSFYLNSIEFREYLETVSQSYDIVLVDGPTFQKPSDLLAVAQASGRLVLNMRQGVASKKALKALIEATSFTQISILGLVFINTLGIPSLISKRKMKKEELGIE